VILLFIVGFVFWSAIIDRLLEFVPQLVNRRKARLAISGVAVATLFAGDLSFARLVVLPLAISTLVTKYNAGEVRGPRRAVGERPAS
jgi:cytochrome c oxidase assembly factor CtaG